MQKNKSFNNYKDYFSKADNDFFAAQGLLEEKKLESACALLQEAVGKYLAGYAFYKAESVNEIHDIAQLFSEAESCNGVLKKFQLLSEVMKKYWTDEEYPVLVVSKLNKEEMEKAMRDARELIKNIMEEVGNKSLILLK